MSNAASVSSGCQLKLHLLSHKRYVFLCVIDANVQNTLAAEGGLCNVIYSEKPIRSERETCPDFPTSLGSLISLVLLGKGLTLWDFQTVLSTKLLKIETQKLK